jgi:N6-adenosine-specific RNA methylase IME4
MSAFRVVCADPPWAFGDKLPGGRGASDHYPVLKLHEIQRFPLPEIADVAMLVLWRVGAMAEEAYEVVRAWGFVPKSEIVWIKTGVGTPEAILEPGDERPNVIDPHMGLGHYIRNSHEIAIVATRGRFEVANKGVRSVIVAPIGVHSEKPRVFYDLVEKLAGEGPYAELFARKRRDGWSAFGNQLEPVTEIAEPAVILPPKPLHTEAAWSAAQQHAEARSDVEKTDPTEITKLPRHKVKRFDGVVVPACCALCKTPQFVCPAGVICALNHSGEPSICGCASCGLAEEHTEDCPEYRPPARAKQIQMPAPATATLPIDAVAAAREQMASAAGRARYLDLAVKEGLLDEDDRSEGDDAAFIKLQFRAPAGWFHDNATGVVPMPRDGLPGENIATLQHELTLRGVQIGLVDLAKWTVTRRDVARVWLMEGGEAPEWIAALIGVEGLREAPAPSVSGFFDRPAATTSEPGQLALPAANANGTAAKKRGRPPGAKNKPKGGDAWARAKAAMSGDEEEYGEP